MRYLVPSLAATFALLALGCGGGSGSQSPLAPATPATTDPLAAPVLPDVITSVQAGLGGVTVDGAISESALAIYTLDIDPAALTATASLKATREATANDDLYLLSIDSFLKSDSLKVTGISSTATTVDINYTIEHPFPQASDPTGTPNGSTNRADLGIAGRVLFLTDVTSATGNTFFDETGASGGSVIANTDLVANADAYYTPAGLLALSGTANTFPYKTLVDETGDGSRVGVSNGGTPQGNFGADGWTRDELASGWTGFGVLHQGQVTAGSVALNKAALSGGFTLDVAVLAKYNDPRGGTTPAQKKANRLPPASADATLFAYRMPHGALDVEKVTFEADGGGFWTNLISGSTMEFKVADFDARATETVETDLSLDLGFGTVAVGEAGAPTLAVCIPGVLGDATVIDTWDPTSTLVDDDSLRGGDAGMDTGEPGDELYYINTVTKGAIGGQTDGTYRGMVRAIDVEDALDPGLTIPLDGTLAPLSANLPRPIGYQSFDVDLITPNDPPTATFVLAASTIQSATSGTVTALTYGDPDGDNISVDIDWNGDGDWDDAGELVSMTLPGTGGAPVNQVSPADYINTDLVDDVINIGVRFSDGFASPISAGSYPLTVGPNRAPVISGAPVLNTTLAQVPVSLTLNAGTATATDPEGDAIDFVATSSLAPLGPFGPVASLPISAMGPFNTAGTADIRLYARDANHQNLVAAQPDSATVYPTQTATLQNCPVAPFTSPNVTAFWLLANRTANAASGTTWGWLDIGSVTFPNSGASGAVVSTNTSGTGGPTFFPFSSQNFQRISQPAASASARVNMTNFAAAPIIDATTSRNILNLQPHQVEVDPLGRVLFLTKHQADDQRAIGGVGASGNANSGIYMSAGNLHRDVKFFDYNFNTNPLVTTLTGTITTTESPVAMAVDPRPTDYAVWTLDTAHVLRKYARSGATTYAAVPSATMDISSIIGTNTGTGDANHKVHDFVINAHNGAFYVLVQTMGVATTPGNGLVYRIECDGSFSASLGGNPNPLRIILNASTTQNYGADININQHNASGTLLTGEQDSQILVSSYNAAAGQPEMRILNANLGVTASADNNQRMTTVGIGYLNGLYSKGSSDYTNYDYWWTTGAPAGWD